MKRKRKEVERTEVAIIFTGTGMIGGDAREKY